VSDTVYFKFDTGSQIVDLATTYTYTANEIVDATINDFEPCGACSHYMNNPSSLSTTKDASGYACMPGDASLTFHAGPAEQAQGSDNCYAEVNGKYRQCATAEGGKVGYSYEITGTGTCLEVRPLASPPPPAGSGLDTDGNDDLGDGDDLPMTTGSDSTNTTLAVILAIVGVLLGVLLIGVIYYLYRAKGTLAFKRVDKLTNGNKYPSVVLKDNRIMDRI